MRMDKIYYNGKIITMSNQKAEAVLIKDGRIQKAGDLKSVEREAGYEVERVDLQGRCLMPSFIDTHSHIVLNGQMSLFANLSDCRNFNEIILEMKNYIRQHKITEKGIAVGYGYDHNFLEEQRHPDKRILDQVSRQIPVVILHVSGHLECVNSVVLELCKVDEGTKDPKGGRIGRFPESREPDGYLEEAGMALAGKVMEERLSMDEDAIMEEMQNIYLQNGITTVQDGASDRRNLGILKKMADQGTLKVDVVAYPVITGDGKTLIEEFGDYDRRYRNRLKIGGYKIILDGSPQGRSAWLSKPYLGGEGTENGYPYWEDEAVKGFVSQAVKEGRQILAHCNGDGASEQFLNAYEAAVAEEGKEELRPVMIHCQTVRKDQLERMAKMGMIASMFVGHVWYWGDVHRKNLGEERGNSISPARDAIDQGVIVNFHQDTPVTKPDMLHSVWCSVNRVSLSGRVIGENQKISVYEALKAVTIYGAYEYFEEDEKGSIEEGKKADLVILSQSPLEVEPDKIKEIQVLETIKEGKVVYKK